MKYQRKARTVRFYAWYDEHGILNLEALQTIFPLKAGDNVLIDDWVLYEPVKP